MLWNWGSYKNKYQKIKRQKNKVRTKTVLTSDEGTRTEMPILYIKRIKLNHISWLNAFQWTRAVCDVPRSHLPQTSFTYPARKPLPYHTVKRHIRHEQGSASVIKNVGEGVDDINMSWLRVRLSRKVNEEMGGWHTNDYSSELNRYGPGSREPLAIYPHVSRIHQCKHNSS